MPVDFSGRHGEQSGDDVPSLFDQLTNPEPMEVPLMDRTIDVPYDLAEGERLRDEALAKVQENAELEYRAAFARIVADFARMGRSFTSEDVTARIGMPPSGSPNAVGALTRAAAMRHGFVKVGRTKAQRTNQHASEITVWGKP